MAQNNNIPDNLPTGDNHDFVMPGNLHMETTEEERSYFESSGSQPAPSPTINISNHFTSDTPPSGNIPGRATDTHSTTYISSEPETYGEPQETFSSEHKNINMADNSSNKGASNTFLKYVLIAGFVVILFILSFALVSFLPEMLGKASSSASAFLSGIFSSKPKIELSLDKSQVASGEPFTVSWKNASATSTSSGNYTIGFKCISGITVQTIGNKPVVCGSDFPVGSSNGSITLIAISKNNQKNEVPFNVSFYSNGQSAPSLTNSASIIVDGSNGTSSPTATSTHPAQNQNTSATSTEKTGYTSGTVTHTGTAESYYYPANGRSDLAITLVKVGQIGSDGTFYNTTSIAPGSRILIQFAVSNIGTAPSGAWSLNASLPSSAQNERNFASGAEPSLRPGDSYTLTLAFDTYDGSGTNAIISLISGTDSNPGNNSITIPLASSGGYNNPTGSGLSVVIENIGLYNQYSNQFYSYSNQYQYGGQFSSNSTVGVKFRVTNNSSVATGPWSFSAILPTSSNQYSYYGYNSGYNYSSPAEPSLAPGQSADFTIAFSNPNVGNNTLTIVANSNLPQTGQNSASQTIYVSY